MFQKLVEEELVRARTRHGRITTLHEGYAVLLEEVDEFWDEVKKKRPASENVLNELIQIGAMAQRIAEDCVSI